MTIPEQALPETTVTARRRSFYGIKVTDITLPGGPCRKVVYPAPLPGVIIFVHGVNSTGEWFDAADLKIGGKLVRRGRPRGSTKEQVSLRLDKEVIAKFKSGGPGWQSRMNDALRKAAGV